MLQILRQVLATLQSVTVPTGPQTDDIILVSSTSFCEPSQTQHSTQRFPL